LDTYVESEIATMSDEQTEEQKRPLVFYVLKNNSGMTETEAKSKGVLACDALVSVPIWLDKSRAIPAVNPDHRQQVISWTPDGTPMPSLDIFRVWGLICFDLSTRPDLPPAWKMLCAMVNNLIESTMKNPTQAPQLPSPITITPPIADLGEAIPAQDLK
jgi:hypothetical protein